MSFGTRIALAASSGAALTLSFPGYDWTPLVWIALVPLLVAVRDRSPGVVFGLAWLQTAVFSSLTLSWLGAAYYEYGPVPVGQALGALGFVASVIAVGNGLGVTAACWTSRRTAIPLYATLPVAGVAAETALGQLPFGLSCNALGYAAWRWAPIAQTAEVVGVHGISFLALLVNAALFELVSPSGDRRRARTGLAIAAALLFGFIGLGSARLAAIERVPAAGELRIAIVPGEIPQIAKWESSLIGASLRFFSDRTRRIVAEKPDLVIWPETGATFYLQRDGRYPTEVAAQRVHRDRLLALAREVATPLLVGSLALRQEKGVLEQRNRMSLIDGGGDITEVYDKRILAPWGEYMPFRDFLPGFRRNPGRLDFLTPGTRATLFEAGGARLAVAICFEIVFPEISHESARLGADVIVTPSNDAWYSHSVAPTHLLAMSVFRAIETRRPVVRVSNEGISAFIDPTGRVRRVERETVSVVRWPATQTFLVRYGNLPGLACLALTFAGVLISWFRPARRGSRSPRESRRCPDPR